MPGKASVGAWLSYGLGSSDSNLPTFVVMVAQPGSPGMVPTVTSRMWGSAFLPGTNAGVKMRSAGEPVLYLDDPRGVTAPARRTFLDGLKALNQHSYNRLADPEIATRSEGQDQKLVGVDPSVRVVREILFRPPA